MRSSKRIANYIIALACFCIWSASAQQNVQPSSNSTPAEGKPPADAPQQPGQPAQLTLQSEEVLRVTSRMVLVDAVVTDDNAKPVTNLKAEDFQIFEDGKPQNIRGFGAHSPELFEQQAALVAPKQKLPADMFTNITDFRAEYGPLTIFLVDSLNTSWEDQVYLRQALVQYLRGMGPRKNVAIFRLGLYLGLVQDLNADSKLLMEALERIDTDPSLKKLPKEPRNPNDPDYRSKALAASLLGVGETYNREYQVEYMRSSGQRALGSSDAATTLAALRKIAASTAGYPGRKNLIWLSGNFPLATDPFLPGHERLYSFSPYIEQTANLLTNNEIAVYPIDVKGLVPVLPEGGHGNNLADAIGRKILAFGVVHTTMDQIAEQTGGRAFYNSNDFEHGIETSVQHGSTYYTMSYYPTNKKWNGKFRKIELKVNGKGLHIQYRHGYYAEEPGHLTPQQLETGQQEFQTALALDAPDATLIPIISRVTAPGKEHAHTYVEIAVDPHSVVFQPQRNNRAQAEVEFVTIVLDANGKPLTSKMDTLNTNLTAQTFAQVMKTRLSVRQIFDLQAGDYMLRIGVRDLKSNSFGTVVAKVEVPKVEATTPQE